VVTPVAVKLWFYCVLETNWIRQPEKQVPYYLTQSILHTIHWKPSEHL